MTMAISHLNPLVSLQLTVQRFLRRFRARAVERLGVEIEGKNIRVVGLKEREGGGVDLIGADTFTATADLWSADAAERYGLGDALKRAIPGIDQSALSIEHPTLRIRRMNVPPMPEADLLEAIRWNFREHVDCPMEKYAVGHTPIQSVKEEHRVLLMGFGVSEDAIRDHVQLAKDMGLKLVSLEPAATALLAAFRANGLLKAGAFTVALCLGESFAHFVVFTEHELLFSRPLSGVTLEGLVKMIARNGNLGSQAAEEAFLAWLTWSLDEKKSAAGDAFLSAVETTVGHFMSQLVIEMQRSIDAFCIMYAVEAVPEIYLCGPGVVLPKLTLHVEHSLGVQTRIFDPFQAIASGASLSALSPIERSSYSIAVGLAVA